MERKRHLKIGISSYTDTHTVLGVTGNAEFSGIVTALEFHGDGSNLTNITADAGAYAGTAGFATVAGYAHTAGIATNATTAGSATTATAAATAYSLTGRPNIEITNLDVAGIATFKEDIYFGDNDQIIMGDGSDLKIYHDGSNSYVEDAGTGALIMKGTTLRFRSPDNEKIINAHQNGSVDLFFDDSKKFETTQSGIIVTGIATADGFVGPLEGNVTGDLTGDVNAGIITAVSGNFTGNVTIGGTLTYEDVTNVDSIGIVTARDGIVVNTRGIHVLSGITTLQDLDAQDLNIRNITGSAATFTDSVSLYDNDRIYLGTSQEMEIFHGTLGNSFFTSTKPLYIKYGQSGQTHEMFIQNDSITAAKFTDDASVELYYNGGKKLETVGGGVTITGDLRVSGVVTATRFESTSSGTPSIDSPNNLDLNAINVAVSTDMSVGRNLTVVGFVSAANFYGDGSGLVNVPAQSYVGNAGVATYAQTAGIATYAQTAGIATVAENLTGDPDISITSATAGGTILRTGAAGTVRLDRGDGNFTGVVTATTFYGDFQGSGSGITGITATYANTAGVSTVSQGLTGTPDIEVANLNVSGISTFTGNIQLNRSFSNEGITFKRANVYKGGIEVGTSVIQIASNGTQDLMLGSNNLGGTSGDVVIASVGATSGSNDYSTGWGRMAVFTGFGTAQLWHQNVKKFETTGIGVTVFGNTETQTLNVTGVSTFNDKVAIGTDVASNSGKLHFATADGYINRSSISVGNPITDYGLYVVDSTSNANSNLHQNYVRQTTNGNYSVSVGAANAFRVSNNDGSSSSAGNPGGMQDSDVAFVVNPDTSTELRYNYDKKLETTGVGATVFGTTETQQLNVSGVSTFSGDIGSSLIPASDDTYDLGAPNDEWRNLYIDGLANVDQFLCSSSATFQGNVEINSLNISGVSTFLDGGNGEIKVFESSGDPIIQKSGGGLLHFRTNNGFDIEDNSGNLFARYGSGGGGVGDGVSLYHNVVERVATTNAGVVVTGILTATSFRGDGSQLSGVLAASEAGISVQDDQSAVGVSTTIDFGSGLSVSPVSAGVVTVTSGAAAGISPVIAGMIF
tara:strand:- start:3038 stop:6280 length:3243 start_codon:yes stop_codon:yes gene_type:complete